MTWAILILGLIMVFRAGIELITQDNTSGKQIALAFLIVIGVVLIYIGVSAHHNLISMVVK